jgi:hypothetical protein
MNYPAACGGVVDPAILPYHHMYGSAYSDSGPEVYFI